jgi:fructose-1,6-bisphosphatase/inositol monophosphatase family enzyme
MVLDDKVKVFAQQMVDKIYRKVRRVARTDFHRWGTSIGIGADGTSTKYIDQIAEDVAVSLLEKTKVKVNLLSEEVGFIDNGGKYVFVLDPVDGTRNAYRGIPFYSVSLGIGTSRLGDVEYGIVKNIPTGDVFIAEKGRGAFLNNQQVMVPEIPDKMPISSLTLGKNVDPFTLNLAQRDIVRTLGSASLEMCMIAVGALDYYVVGQEYIRVTDIAASTLIVREAGGVVTNAHGVELDMPFSLHERSSVIAAPTKELIQNLIG